MSGRHRLNLLVPMAGTGKRFLKAGYTTFKPFIPVLGKPMIRHVTEAFPASIRKFVITSKDLLTGDQVSYVKKTLGCEIVDVPLHTEGPAYSIYLAGSRLPLDESFFISYCDHYWSWDFKVVCANLDRDGVIYTHIGFHPHLIRNSHSAFCLPREDDSSRVRAIQEKAPFTDDWMNEPLSIGVYYVRNGHDMMAGIADVVEKDVRTSGEFYPSLLYNHLIAGGGDVYMQPVSFYVHWGIPEQLRDFLRWYAVVSQDRYFRPVTGPDDPDNVVSMGGLGVRMKRISDQPKALMLVQGRPMCRFVADHFPARSLTAITVRPVAEVLRRSNFGGDLVVLDKQTRSQYETLAAAVDVLRSRRDFFLTSCDAYGLFDFGRLRRFIRERRPDAIIFTFVPSLTQSKMAGHHTHVSCDGDRVTAVHIKSQTGPDDPGLAGFFWVRDGRIFDGIHEVPQQSDHEMSADHIFKHFVDSGLDVARFDLDHYIHLGTAEEFLEYRYWMDHACELPDGSEV